MTRPNGIFLCLLPTVYWSLTVMHQIHNRFFLFMTTASFPFRATRYTRTPYGYSS